MDCSAYGAVNESLAQKGNEGFQSFQRPVAESLNLKLRNTGRSFAAQDKQDAGATRVGVDD